MQPRLDTLNQSDLRGKPHTEDIALVKTVCSDNYIKRKERSYYRVSRMAAASPATVPQWDAGRQGNEVILLVTRRFGWLQFEISALSSCVLFSDRKMKGYLGYK